MCHFGYFGNLANQDCIASWQKKLSNSLKGGHELPLFFYFLLFSEVQL